MSHCPDLMQIVSMKDNNMKLLNYFYYLARNKGCRYAIHYTNIQNNLGLSRKTLYNILAFLKKHKAIRDVEPSEKEKQSVRWNDYHWIEVVDLASVPDFFAGKKYSELHAHNSSISLFLKSGGFWEVLEKWNFKMQKMQNQDSNEESWVKDYPSDVDHDLMGKHLPMKTPFSHSLEQGLENEASKNSWVKIYPSTDVQEFTHQMGKHLPMKTPFSHSLEQKEKTGRDERNVVSPSLEKVKKEKSSKIGFCCGAEERGIGIGGTLENGNMREMPKVIFVQGMKIFVIENIYQIENINIRNNISNTNTIEEENVISDDKALDIVLPILNDNAIGSNTEEDLPLPPPAEGLGEYAMGIEEMDLGFLTQTEADELSSECDSSSEERRMLEEARNAFYGLTGTESGIAVKGLVSFCENKKEVKAMVNDEDKKARREEIRQMALNAIGRASAAPEPSKLKNMQQQKLEDEKKEKAERFQVKRGKADASGPQPFELYAFIASEADERGKKIPALIPKDAKRLKDFAKRCRQNGLEWQDCLKEIFLIMQRKKKIFSINEVLAAWNFDEAFDTLVNKKQEKIEQQKKIDLRSTGNFVVTLVE